MNEIELLEALNLQVSDFQSSVTAILQADQVRQDLLAGTNHLIQAALVIMIMLLSWIAVMVTRR